MRLTPVSRSDLIRRLESLGWQGPYSGGRHQYMVKGNVQLTIPNPHGRRDIGVNLLKLVLNEAGIPRDDWLRPR
ncbi:MAG TPA: type II toxin-antitoxin system HicA family toxin [Lacunisphaera sp.]|nr:type II toxin-antitoxin system HicA family toxin [Lacunisphaera sp.]